MRWVLLDEVVEIQKGKKALTQSHIPETVYSPEVLMIEMIAQTGALLLGAETDFKENLVFAKIEQAQFETDLKPGAPLEIEAVCENLHEEGAWIQGSLRHQQKVVGQAKCLLVHVKGLLPDEEKPITFHDAFMQHFQVREKVK